jgi:two-component system OmpR family response regulator
MRLLLIEDDLKIASFVLKGFREAGFVVHHAREGEAGLHMALHEPYDAAIIDIMLPKMDGLTLIHRLRLEKINTPVIILSAKRSVDDRVKGLQSGGDDYLTKPFSFSELLARVLALIRRNDSSCRRRPVHGSSQEGGAPCGEQDRTATQRVLAP